jgi:hypothetical protein
MEERQPRIPPSAYQGDRPLAYPYSNDADHLPLEEDANVVPIKSRLEGVAETPLNSRSSKRKSSGGRSAAGKQKSSPSFRQLQQSQQNSAQQPFADELRRLEAQAERINQILSDRLQKKAAANSQNPPQFQRITPPSQQAQWQAQQPHNWQPAQPAEEDDTEALKLQARRIRQRLAELEGFMEEPSSAPSYSPQSYSPQSYSPPQQTPPPHSPPYVAPAQPWQTPESAYPPAHEPNYARSDSPRSEAPRNEVHRNAADRSASNAGQAAEELRQLSHQNQFHQPNQFNYPNKAIAPDGQRSQAPVEEFYRPPPNPSQPSTRPRPTYDPSHSPTPGMSAPRRNSTGRTVGRDLWRTIERTIGQYLELPRKPFDRFGDAVLWIAASAILRVGSRYVLASFPMLAPVLSLLLLAPAVMALYLAFCVPKAGWIPIYRLFLITFGLVVGGKL